jgi:ribonuclease-3
MEKLTLADLAALQQTLSITLNDLSLLEQALVHGSYINENPDFALSSNERLEFLGDAVLGLVVAERLYQDFPHLNEGEMTKLRSVLVRRDTLAHIARAFSLGNHLYLGKGEEASGGRHNQSNLAGALEAIIAALFLDQGLTTTREFILRLFDKQLEKVITQGTKTDYKSQLQEFTQSRQQMVTYYLVEAAGPPHDKKFTVEVRSGNTVLGKGTGKSKKEAETKAARLALKRLSNFTE